MKSRTGSDLRVKAIQVKIFSEEKYSLEIIPLGVLEINYETCISAINAKNVMFTIGVVSEAGSKITSVKF